MVARRPRVQDVSRGDRDRLKSIGAVAAKLPGGWRPRAEVIRSVEAVPTIFCQYDDMVGVGGHPISRLTLLHGPNNEGKTLLALGLGLSFLQRGHFFGFADAERTTTDEWVRGLMGEVADHPGFSALPVTTYEQVRMSVRQYCETIAESRAKGELPDDTTGLIVVDSIRKLVPKRLFDELAKGEPKKGEKGGRRRKDNHVDGYGGRAAQLKAALNAAWVDELVPLLADTRMAMVIIARETPKANADSPFAGRDEEEVKVGGGEALRYDASLRLRTTREWVRVDKQVVGERHVVELMKTKVANKEDSIPSCAFHTSNGNLKGTPVGFDPVRDLVELGLDLDVFKLGGGGWIKFEGKNLGQGFENSLVKLYKDDAKREAVERAVRAASEAGR